MFILKYTGYNPSFTSKNSGFNRISPYPLALHAGLLRDPLYLEHVEDISVDNASKMVSGIDEHQSL